MTNSFAIHEIVGGINDGKVKHLPCRDDGAIIWMNPLGATQHVVLNSEVMLTASTPYHRYVHETREDGTHVWRES